MEHIDPLAKVNQENWELIQKNTQLKADKNRLDWLEQQVSVSDVCSYLDWDFNTADTLRQAIDKAVAALEKGL